MLFNILNIHINNQQFSKLQYYKNDKDTLLNKYPQTELTNKFYIASFGGRVINIKQDLT